MARGINKVILIGNLGQDPEIKYFDNGGSVANVTLATSETWKDKQSGQPQERTEWHRVTFHNKLAEIVAEYLKKGSKIYVEGSLRTRKYQKDGEDRYVTEIAANTMQMLDSRGDAGTSPGSARENASGAGGHRPANPPQSRGQDDSLRGQPQHGYPAGGFDDFDEDFPF